MGRALLLLCVAFFYATNIFAQTAPAPLYRDPMTDGAADPVLIWNKNEKNWWMLYTQRRANSESENVAYCYATDIGIASSSDNGQTWVYRGTLDLKIDKGRNSFWAPDVVYHKGKYHLFVAYIVGVYPNWGGVKRMAHFVSKDMWDWKLSDLQELNSWSVIDAGLCKGDDDVWRMWYKDESRGEITMVAKSKNLKKWMLRDEPAIDREPHEGVNVFRYGDYYWMLLDEWHGMRVYRSNDLEKWEKQGLILDKPSLRREDKPSGAHGDVVMLGDKAYVFYFTHPERAEHINPPFDNERNMMEYKYRRSVIQVAPLYIKDGTLVAPRDEPFSFYMDNQ
ncbi:MAG: glycosyl hydrolase [Alistipes sp.]|nr:glycosyl hydrolase [Alistipes sp.]